MLRSIKQLHARRLRASDGEIGQVKDFYFDDQTWTVRYLVADASSWLPGRQVLISPHSLNCLDQTEHVLRVNLTRKQIEDSPSIALHKPVSRQFEEEYYRYYGWPPYWQGEGLWGSSDFPIWERSAKPFQGTPTHPNSPRSECTDALLRSTQAVNGYRLRTAEGMIGHICDFMMNAGNWAIDHLVINAGHRLLGKKTLIPIRIPAKQVERTSHEESAVFVDLTRGGIEQSPSTIWTRPARSVELV